MLKIIERVLNKATTHRFFYVLVRWDTSIGIGSELMRLSLIKATLADMRVTFIRARVPFGHLIFKAKYPRELYSVIESDVIRKEITFLRFLLEYYYGTKFLAATLILTILHFRKTLYREHAYGQEGLYFPDKQYTQPHQCQHSLPTLCRTFRNPPGVHLASDIESKCKAACNELGVGGRWYVCLHIRTSAFYNDNAWYRNSSIDNYYQAIDYIIAQGGVVVRMGEAIDGYISKPRTGLIDYPATRHKSELMDLYLIQNCKFYLGTQSGIIDTALLLKKPVLSVNSLHFAIPGTGTHNLTIYKKIFDRRRGVFLSFDEAMARYGQIISSTFDVFSRDFEWIENSSDEIVDAVKEIMASLEKSRLSATPAQRFVTRRLKKMAREHNYSHDLAHTQALFSRVIVGREYLEEWIRPKFR